MVTVLSDLDRVDLWHEALAGNASWEKIFSDFRSSVDWPGSFFYGPLMDAYPEAKVLLSVREPQRWAASMRKTVLLAHRGGSLMSHLSQARALVDPAWRAYNEMTGAMLFGAAGLVGAGCDDEATLADIYRRHIEEVKATVPAGRLLVWSPVDGWPSLCDFLGVAAPEQPFPHVNDSAMFEARVVDGCLAALNRVLGAETPG
jgi:hypothetical protein